MSEDPRGAPADGAAVAAPLLASGEPARVLVVEDDPTVAEVVLGYLRRAGYRVELATDGAEALRLALPVLPDLVVLDLMMPGIDGLEVCRRLREHGPVPVIMLTALGEETHRVAGLEAGADDYVTKPFSPRELVLRVTSVLRRSGALPVEAGGGLRRVTAGPFTLDLDAHRALRDDREVTLTSREFDLLAFLVTHPGRAYSREELMAQVWGWAYGDRSTVTVHIRRLREKVERDPGVPAHIITVWGVGYRFDVVGAGAGTAEA